MSYVTTHIPVLSMRPFISRIGDLERDLSTTLQFFRAAIVSRLDDDRLSLLYDCENAREKFYTPLCEDYLQRMRGYDKFKSARHLLSDVATACYFCMALPKFDAEETRFYNDVANIISRILEDMYNYSKRQARAYYEYTVQHS